MMAVKCVDSEHVSMISFSEKAESVREAFRSLGEPLALSDFAGSGRVEGPALRGPVKERWRFA